MNVILVPTLGLDISLLERMANSVDYPIQHKVIIANGRKGALFEWNTRHMDWVVFEFPENLGCGASWNLAPRLFPDERAWLICNDDVQFQPGYLKRICECSDVHAENEPIILLNNSHPYYCFVWTAKGMKDFGLFDENFWPAYYEDCDMNIRHRLAGFTQFRFALPDLPPVNHGKPKCGGIDYNAMLQGVGLFNRRYWKEKWGTDSREKAEFPTPFNSPGCPMSYWKLDYDRRMKMKAIFDEFMADPKASIYD